MQRQSNIAYPTKGFDNLHQEDFIHTMGHISHHNLDQLEIYPYAKALFHQGVRRQAGEEDCSNDLLLSMEYSGAVGTVVMDDLAEVNECLSNWVEVVMDRVQEALADSIDQDNYLKEEKARGDLLVECVHQLKVEREELQGSIRMLEEDSVECWILLAEMQMVAWDFQQFWASLQHGPGNPIIVEDDDEVVEDSTAGDDDDHVVPNAVVKQ